MFYEEKLINGIWQFRHSPNAEFEPMGLSRLNDKCNELSEKLAKKQSVIDKFGSFLLGF